MSSLFRSELVWPEAPKGQPTVRIAEQTVTFDLEGVPFAAHLIDTPGYGDMDLQREVAAAELQAVRRNLLRRSLVLKAASAVLLHHRRRVGRGERRARVERRQREHPHEHGGVREPGARGGRFVAGSVQESASPAMVLRE